MADFTSQYPGQTIENKLGQVAANAEAIANLQSAVADKYEKPSGGIPYSDMSSGVKASLDKADGAYVKPGSGIPKTDLSSGVQSSLDKADAALPKANVKQATGSSTTDVMSQKAATDAIKEVTDDLESGDIIPALAANLEPWADQDDVTVPNTWDETIRTTAGSTPIVTEKGGSLVRIIPKTDFACSKLITTGYNQLRLVANGGAAVAVGTGFYFPVPKLTFGEYGSARENNGILFTNSAGENMNPTVYFKPLANGVPTSITDGTQLTAQEVLATANQNGGIYTDHNLKFYLTPGPGYLIVSGITQATTCAHIAWEDWYDKYVSPTDADDAGGSIDLSSIFSTLHSDVNKALVIGGGGISVADSAEWTSDTNCKWTRRVGRVASPSWTNTQNEDETFTHSITVSGMKSGGKAEIEGHSQQALVVEGTTVSYVDENATALSGALKYELAAEATGNLTINRTYVLNDCGIEMLQGASGTAFVTANYARNIADALAEIATHNLNEITRVLCEALNSLQARVKALQQSLLTFGVIKAKSVDALEYTMYGVPRVLKGHGAPSANVVPDNWPVGLPWDGFPCYDLQFYINLDAASGGLYYSINNSAVSGWKQA